MFAFSTLYSHSVVAGAVEVATPLGFEGTAGWAYELTADNNRQATPVRMREWERDDAASFDRCFMEE